MRFNRFVFLNRPMLSLETHLGVTVSPQAPFPTDFVTLPVHSKPPPLRLIPFAAREGHARYCKFTSIERCIPNMLKQLSRRTGRLGCLGVPYVMSQTQA